MSSPPPCCSVPCLYCPGAAPGVHLCEDPDKPSQQTNIYGLILTGTIVHAANWSSLHEHKQVCQCKRKSITGMGLFSYAAASSA